MILRFGNKRGGEDKQHDCQIVSSEQLGKKQYVHDYGHIYISHI
jgi:hypothetical protein